MSGTNRLAAFLLLLIAPSALRADMTGGSFRPWRYSARDLALGGAATLMAPAASSQPSTPTREAG